MSKTVLKFSIIVLCLTLFNCKNETETFNDYQYATQENILVCNTLNTKLYFEALLSFEDDITDKYDPKNKNIRRAYSFFTRDALANRANYQEIVSPHTLKVFNALKKDKDLWIKNNSINYHADIFNCIGENLKDKDLKTTFNALVSTNSMRSDIFGAPLIKQVKNAHTDRYMATFVALDLFYAHLFNVDPTKVTEKPENKDSKNPALKDALKKSSNNVQLSNEQKS